MEGRGKREKGRGEKREGGKGRGREEGKGEKGGKREREEGMPQGKIHPTIRSCLFCSNTN